MKISSVFSVLCISSATAFAPSISTLKPALTSLQAYQTVAEAIAEAEMICAQAPNSEECRVAWDIVEELESTDSHFRSSPGKFTPLEAARGGAMPPPSGVPPPPGAPVDNAKEIQALLYGYDLLARKLDPKLDNLVAMTDKLMELGANDPSVPELHQRAADLKRNIRDVYDYLARQTQ